LFSELAWAESEQEHPTDVFALLQAKSIKIRATGDNIVAIRVEVENLTGDNILVPIPIGT
jgi:hypothetical protein